MKEIIVNGLKDDHKQLMNVLYQLEQCLLRLKKFNNISGEIETLLNIIDYIEVYPETWHHPAEDIIFSHLLDKLNDKDHNMAIEVADIIEEHGVLESLTANLKNLIDEVVLSKKKLAIFKLDRIAHQYITAQLVHIEKEQSNIFPLVNELFDEQDWQTVSQEIDKELQPLPYSPEKEEYQHILSGILSSNPVTSNKASQNM